MPRRYHHGATDSTNERAFAAIAEGSARHGDVHVAHAQSAGRGRRGRPWYSEAGMGLYVSVVLMPSVAPPPAALTIAGGLSVLDAVRGLGLVRARMVWPNDVLVGDGKLGGILVETRGLDAARPCYVLGVGMNVGQRTFPSELTGERPVTSLALEGLETSVPEAERALLDRLESRLAQVERDSRGLARDFVEACGLGSEHVCCESGAGRWVGRLLAFSVEEGITLRDEAGGDRRLPLELLHHLAPLADD